MSITVDRILAVAPEMGIDDLTADEVAKQFSKGAVVEVFQHGFAVVMPEGTSATEPGAFIWMFYVDPAFRGQGYGREIMKAVRAKHGQTYFMRLRCFGGKRATWFARQGFKITERHDDLRVMSEWRESPI